MNRRHFTPLAAALAIATLLFAGPAAYFLQTEKARQQGQRAEAETEVEIHARVLERQFHNLVSAPALLAGLLRPQDGEAEFRALADSLIRMREGISSLQLAQADGRLLTHPPTRGAGTTPQRLPAPLMVIGPPRIAFEPEAVVVRQPVASAAGGQPWGTLIAIAPLADLRAAARLNELSELDGYEYRLTHQPAEGAETLFLSTGDAPLEQAVVQTMRLPNGESMMLAAAPRAGWSGRTEILAELGALALGWALIVLLLQRALRQPQVLREEVARRTWELAESNRSLQLEVGERAQVERALQHSHALLDSVFENMPAMILVKGAQDLRILRANRYSELVLGRDRASLVGRAGAELLPAAAAQALEELEGRVLHSRHPAALAELRVEAAGGQARVLHVKALPLFNPEGEVEHLLQLAEDVTEREALQDALSDQLHFLEQLLDAIPAPIFFKDTQCRYMGCNSAFERFLARTREQIVGTTVYDVAPKELADVYHRADQALIDNPGTQVYETEVAAADGRKHDVTFYKATFHGRDGAVGGIVGVFLDITQRKSAERHVHQLNRTLTVLTEINEAIFRTRDRQSLLDRACEVLVEQGGFPLAWIYLAGAPGEAPRVLSAKGVATDFVPAAMALLGAQRGHCPLPGVAEGSDAALICNTMGCCQGELVERASALGFASLAVLPLRSGGRSLGGLAIFGAEAQVFGEHEIRLLRELADDLSYALEALGQEERRKRAEQDLRLAAQVFENSLEGIMITDARNRILKVNKAFSAVTGYAPEEVIGQNPRILSSGHQGPEFYRAMWQSLQDDGEWHGEVKNRRRNGEFYPEWLTISVVKNEAGEITNHVAVFTDISTRKRIEERLNFLAHYDVLTELPNRLLFVDRLEQSILKARHSGRRVGVMFIDLDRFKLINETFGQSAGDLLLMEAARRLSGCLRHTDSASRMGGDEFAVVLSELASVEEAATVAQRVLEALARSFQFDGREAYTSASIGVSIFPEDGQDSQALAKNAEAAMYRAMDEGGNKCHFYHQEMNAKSSERVSMEAGLRRAIERGELVLHYQPLVDAATWRIVGAEALLRWHRPDKGFVPPAAFVPLLEETKLIVPVGEWILRMACEHNQAWRQATGADLCVCVNFSAVQMAEPDIIGRIAGTLRDLSFDPRHLDIELTESVIMRDTARAGAVLEALKALGLQLSIDDFGTGYSSLSYLRRFPFDSLKIDRSFVCDTPGAAEATAIVRAIVAMGRSLGMRIIAEGVETAEQVGFLTSVGCDLLQGWGMVPALPQEEFLKLLQARRRIEPPQPAPACASDAGYAPA